MPSIKRNSLGHKHILPFIYCKSKKPCYTVFIIEMGQNLLNIMYRAFIYKKWCAVDPILALNFV